MTGYAPTAAIWPLLASSAFQVALAVYLWRRRETPGARPLALIMVTSAVWCVGDAGELAAIEPSTKIGWFLVRDALALPGMTVSLWFSLEYANRERWLRRPVVAVLVGAVLVLLSLYVVDGGRLLWTRLWWDGEVRGELAPLGLLSVVYGYAIALLGTGILLLVFARSPAHRLPVALIVLGQAAVRIAYPLGLLNIPGVPALASTAIALDFASLMYVVALFRFRLFDLVPLARDAILRSIPDGLLVLDADDRVADVNDTVLQRLGLLRRDVLGRPLHAALAAFPDLVRAIAVRDAPPGEASVETDAGACTCEVTSTPLADWQGRTVGRLVLLHDITALRRVEAQLVERERALAAAEERERLARELHDGLAQDLWLAKLKTTRLATQPDLGAEARALTEEVTAAVDAGIAEARRAVSAMRLATGGNGSLRDLLARSLEDFEDRFGLPVEFVCDDALPSVPPRVEAETLRIVQEALTNVRRHADATLVRVRIGIGDDGSGGARLILDVTDNGRGFDPAAVGATAYGLAGMRERAALTGADIEIRSAPRQGTLVRLVLPPRTAEGEDGRMLPDARMEAVPS